MYAPILPARGDCHDVGQRPTAAAGCEIRRSGRRSCHYSHSLRATPTSIERSKGPFALFITNRSGFLEDTFSLVLKPVSPTALGSAVPSLLDLHSTQSKQRDHQLIDPMPGSIRCAFNPIRLRSLLMMRCVCESAALMMSAILIPALGCSQNESSGFDGYTPGRQCRAAQRDRMRLAGSKP